MNPSSKIPLIRPLLVILVFLFATFTAQAQSSLRILTWNIRYDNPGDGVNRWSNRKDKVAELLKKYDPDIFGVQEALSRQVSDLQVLLPDYAYYGLGRDDGKTSGEYSAIFYKKEKFVLKQSGTFWLSPTPEVPGSKGWDAAITRLCSWVQLKDKGTEGTLFVFNTHFDHIGKTARANSVLLIKEKVLSLAKESPFILMGDFNFEPDELPYHLLMESSRWNIRDSHDAFEGNQFTKPCTFTGFAVNGGVCKRIDYIFTNEHFSVKSCAIIHDNDGKHYPSDHLPVMVDLGW